jgi:hypothetical protein
LPARFLYSSAKILRQKYKRNAKYQKIPGNREQFTPSDVFIYQQNILTLPTLNTTHNLKQI